MEILENFEAKKTRFAELKEKGYANTVGDERAEYKALKAELEPELEVAPEAPVEPVVEAAPLEETHPAENFVIINGNIKHNGTEYVAGQKVSVSDVNFKALKDQGFLN